jgi:hypothetical protein
MDVHIRFVASIEFLYCLLSSLQIVIISSLPDLTIYHYDCYFHTLNRQPICGLAASPHHMVFRLRL